MGVLFLVECQGMNVPSKVVHGDNGKPARREYGKRSQSSVCCGMATHKKQKQMRKQIQKQMHTSNTGIRVRLVKLEILVMLIILLTLSNTSSISNNRNTDNTRKC